MIDVLIILFSLILPLVIGFVAFVIDEIHDYRLFKHLKSQETHNGYTIWFQ